MRPVKKKKVGERVSYLNSRNELIEEIVQERYSPYGKAKMPLLGNLGWYCSYCESPKTPDELAVEHVEPKGANGDETAWDNFILSCRMCNSIKGRQVIHASEYHWPHKDNTYNDFIYTAGGVVLLNPNLSREEKEKAKKLFDLVKLGAYEGSEMLPTQCDYRWKKRLETWTEAERLKNKMDAGTADVEEIIRMAKSLGYWSVWFTVFKENREVRRRLATDFLGTCVSYFEE